MTHDFSKKVSGARAARAENGPDPVTGACTPNIGMLTAYVTTAGDTLPILTDHRKPEQYA